MTYWKALKRALSDYFESGNGYKEEFARHLHWEISELDEVVDCDNVPDYDVGKQLESLLIGSINSHATLQGPSGLRPGAYRIYPRPGQTGPVTSMFVSNDGEIEFRPKVLLPNDLFKKYMVIRNLEAEITAIR